MSGETIKYGLIVYNKARFKGWNYGDTIQTLAIESIYKRMGIDESRIEKIEYEDLPYYKAAGNYKVKLPMQGCFEYRKNSDVFPLSEDLIPVYIGFSRVSGFHLKKNYFSGYGPVGCRDEATKKKLEKFRVDSFLSGCYTICLPRRESAPVNGKVFLVDQPKGIEEYMPEELKKNIVYVTHETNSNVNLEEKTREMLNRYRDEAALVVTSRLHCASPCMSMGIPVILCRDYFDSRYEWIDKYLKLYTRKQFSEINWYPDTIDIEKIKEDKVNLFINAVNNTDKWSEMAKSIDNHYMSRSRAVTTIPLKTRLYWGMLKISPKLAYYIRKKILWKFTIMNSKE